MPIYEYECKACGHRLEKLQKLSAEPLKDCPSCEASTLSRLISAAGFRLAGSGWYETDFKSGNRKNLAGDQKSASEGDSGSKPNSDSAPGLDQKQASGAKQGSGSKQDSGSKRDLGSKQSKSSALDSKTTSKDSGV